MKVKKAVILVTCSGTEMLPITSVVPKELLPVCGKPVIQYVMQEAVDAGINEIILILSKEKESIAEYFRPNKPLAAELLKQGNTAELHVLEKIWNMAKITVIYQDEQKGLGNAVLLAAQAIGNQPFALLLGETIIKTDVCQSFTEGLVLVFNTHGKCVVGVQEVEQSLVSGYDIFEGQEFEEGIYTAKKLLKKQKQSTTNSNLTFCGRYVLKPEIFKHLGRLEPEMRSEIQLIDALQQLLVNEAVIGLKLEGERFDIKNPKGLLFANLCMTDCG